MADQVTIKPETNKVELTDQRRQISVTDNRTGTSINLTQTDPQVIQVNTPGPQGATGPRGEQGEQGDQGGAFCTLVIEPPSEGKIRGAMYLSSWNEVYVAIG